MVIRTLKAEEFELQAELSEYAFQYKLTAEEKESRKKRFKPEQVWGLFDEQGNLNAKLSIIPFEVFIQGASFSMGGIASVSSWPESRRKGSITQLLSHALQTMHDSGQVLSFLHPFSYAFYRKYGWEMLSDYKKYTISVDNFPDKTAADGEIRRDVKDPAVLNTVYEAYAKTYNGMLVRNEDWWTRAVLGDGEHTAVYYSTAGKPEGYLLYKMEKKELLIDEFVSLNEQARKALWTYISNHDSMVTKAEVTFVPIDDYLPYMFPNPRIDQEIVPYGMARIVSMQAFVESYPFAGTGQNEELLVKLKDEYAPWNEGVWSWTVTSNGMTKLNRVHETDTLAESRILHCDIQSLTAMLMGYMRPTVQYRAGKIDGNEEAAAVLERMIPSQRTLIMDFF